MRCARTLCGLEGFAALLGLTALPNNIRNKEATIFCDNAGFVAVFKKRHSKCPYSYTMAKALYDVGKGLGCKVNVEKTKRCSGNGEIVADHLSKGNWEAAWPLMPGKEVDPKRVSVTLLRWIANPYVNLSLGQDILRDMKDYTKVLYSIK